MDQYRTRRFNSCFVLKQEGNASKYNPNLRMSWTWDECLPLESLFYICGWNKINSNGLIIYENVEEQTKMIFSHIQCFCQQFLWIIKLPVSRKKRYTLPDKMIRMVQASIWQDMFINNKNWGSLSQNSNLNEKADKFSSWQSNYRITI